MLSARFADPAISEAYPCQEKRSSFRTKLRLFYLFCLFSRQTFRGETAKLWLLRRFADPENWRDCPNGQIGLLKQGSILFIRGPVSRISELAQEPNYGISHINE